MTKIGIIVNSPSPHQQCLLQCLAQHADADTLIAYAYPSNPKRNWGVPKVSGHSVEVPYRRGPGSKRRLQEWMLSEDRDVWILSTIVTSMRAQQMAGALSELDTPWAFWGEPPRPRTGLKAGVRDWMLKSIINKSNGVIGTGVESARRYQQILADHRPTASVPYFIPVDEWLELPAVRQPCTSDPIRFVTLAQLIHRKGIDLLIKACTKLPRGRWRLDVYGEGSERQVLQKQIDEHELPITLHQPLPFDGRKEAFAGKHCFVLPTRWDGWGMVIVEALAAGLPVICSDQTMSAFDFIEDGQQGWKVACNANDIAAAMKQLIDSPELITTMSANARQSVVNYQPSTGADEFVGFCQTLVSNMEVADQ